MCGKFGYLYDSYEEPLPLPPPASVRPSAKVKTGGDLAPVVPFKVAANTRQRGAGGRFVKRAR